MFGPNITSLPCGFVYPFYGSTDGVEDGGCIAALEIYCDEANAEVGHFLNTPMSLRDG